MRFNAMMSSLTKHFNEMVANNATLFEVDADKDEMWNLYLDSFPEGTNPIFRKCREYDCSCCRQFIKNAGNIVVIKNNEIHTIWDFNAGSTMFQTVCDVLDNYIKSKPITDIYLYRFDSVGTKQNVEILENGRTHVWNHFYLELPKNAVCHNTDYISSRKAEYRDTRNVFKRSLDEITMDAVDTVLELINSNTLYRGTEWKEVLNSFKKCKKDYDKLSDNEREMYAWAETKNVGNVIGRIRNHSIGTLLVDISENVDLDTAVRKYEAIVAPSNYKRPKAIFTKKMLEDAQKTVTEMGYMESLGRRFANLDDITVNNILFANRDTQKRVKGAESVFAEMMGEVKTSPKKFDRVEEIGIDKFITDVLPTASSIEAYVENKHENNLVSLIAPKVVNSKTMFKWNNNFSWAYKGNVTDSVIKQNVKNAGGNVEGVLRFSLQWAENGEDNSDLDAHCVEPNGFEIYYYDNRDRNTNGSLDVDNTFPGGKIAVENITWPSLRQMKDGNYEFFVKCYSNRSNRDGFRAEVEFNGQIYKFDYHHAMRTGENVKVATVTLKNGVFTIKPSAECSSAFNSKEMWGVKTNQFVPVSVIMYSPNYWDNQHGIGNRHYMFMLKDCVNDEEPNGFYNEFLKPELDKHKRVFEALGSKMAVEDVEDQLSGLGFSSTKRNELVVKVIGATERVMKIKF